MYDHHPSEVATTATANQTRYVKAELAGAGPEERADLAAWTMMAHSMLNLELAKVRR